MAVYIIGINAHGFNKRVLDPLYSAPGKMDVEVSPDSSCRHLGGYYNGKSPSSRGKRFQGSIYIDSSIC